MGLLEIVRSSEDTADIVDKDDLGTALEIGATGVATAGTAGAAAVIPIAAKALVQQGTRDYFKSVGKKKAYQPLKQVAEEHNEEDTAGIVLGRACAGVCKLAELLFGDDQTVDELVCEPERLRVPVFPLLSRDARRARSATVTRRSNSTLCISFL